MLGNLRRYIIGRNVFLNGQTAELVADRLGTAPAGEIDYDYLAAKVAQQIEIPEVQNYTAATYADAPAHYEINEDELADAIALKVGSLKPEDFEIIAI